jgi:hypothetical protein
MLDSRYTSWRSIFLPQRSFPLTPSSISLVQTVKGNGGGYVNSYTTSITPTAGNLLVMVVASGAADTITVSDNKGNTWNIAKDVILASQRQMHILYVYNCAGGATTITIAGNSGQYPDTAYVLQEWNGFGTADPLDQTVSSTTSSGTTYASGNTPTTTAAKELLIGGIAATTNAPGYTGDGLWANLITQAGFDLYTSSATQYRIVGSTGAYGWTLTNGSATLTAQAVVTFKAAGSGGTTYTQALNETLTLSDTLSRSTTKSLTETLTLTDTIAKIATKVFSEVVSVTDLQPSRPK